VINITKSANAPASLAIEQAKSKSENYRCEGVMSQLVTDFHNKCYMCEDYGSSTLNIEHFKPHRGDRALMFEWANLFLACGHCNNQKLANPTFDNILDCTNDKHLILQLIKFEIRSFPKELAQITAISQDEKVVNTVELLQKVYNSDNTESKTFEAANIRERLINEMLAFNNLVNEYFDSTILEEEIPVFLRKIKRMLSVKSPFTAFKVWVVKSNPYLFKEFQIFLPQ
jgi:HNH endonuclease